MESYEKLIDNRKHFDNFNKTYEGRFFGTVMNDDRYECLLLNDSKTKFKEYIVPPFGLYFILYKQPKRGDYIKVTFRCKNTKKLIKVNMEWIINDIYRKVSYQTYLEPRTMEQLKCHIIKK